MPLVHDLRIALRSLGRRPGFTFTALVTLALGTGVNAAIFGVLDRVVLRPLAFPEPDRLVSITADIPNDAGLGLSMYDALEIGRTSNVLSGLGWVEQSHLTDAVVLTRAEPERVAGAWVSANFFSVLGLDPEFGRGFQEGEDRLGGPRVALLSREAWRSRYGGDRGVLGRTVEVNGQPVTIVGVLPRTVDVPLGGDPPEFWLAQPYSPYQLQNHDSWITEVVARLRPGATIEDLRAELNEYSADVRQRFPDTHSTISIVASPLREHWVGRVRGPLIFLFAGAVLVLLVACANLGILFAARTSARGGEIAVRRALGAGHRRLAVSILAESLLLGILGTSAGCLLAPLVAKALGTFSPVDLPRLDGSLVDLRFLGFAVAIALAAGIGVGVAPVLRALRTSPASVLRTRGAHRRVGLARALIAAESAIVLALLVAAVLAGRGFLDLMAVDPGFSPAGRLIADVAVPAGLTWRSPDGTVRNAAFFRQARQRIAALPGVEAAGFVTNLPLTPASWSGELWKFGETAGNAPGVDWEMAGVGYFDAAGIPVIEGRTFTADDRGDTPLVTVINETLARRYFPAGDAIGRMISGSGADGPWRRIIGIVADVRQQSLGQPETRPMMYIDDQQGFAADARKLVLAARGDPLSQVEAIRRTIRELEPGAIIDGIRPMSSLLDRSAAGARFHMLLLALFAILATVLGLAGIYAVVSDAVNQRRREIALRMALGAARPTVLAAELRRGLTPVLGGIVAGIGIAFAAARVTRGMIAGFDTIDPATVLLISAALLAVAALAVLAPARRASGLAPATVLEEQ